MPYIGMRQSDKQGNRALIEWHPAFIQAIQLELEDYRDILEFHTEHNLTTAPLKIDCVIFKKIENKVIEKNIAAIFRKINIMEYKSPDDCIAIEDFYKVCGYAYLYASLEKIPITAITLSFIGNTYPRKLFKHLTAALECEVEENIPGIYTVKGDRFPIQIIDSRKLTEEDNLWLKNLSNRLNYAGAKRVIEEVNLRGKTSGADAYIYAISMANTKAIEGVIRMSRQAKTLEQVLKDAGWIARWEAQGEAKGEVRGKHIQTVEIAKNMMNLGLSMETIVSATKLDPEKVRELGLEQAM